MSSATSTATRELTCLPRRAGHFLHPATSTPYLAHSTMQTSLPPHASYTGSESDFSISSFNLRFKEAAQIRNHVERVRGSERGRAMLKHQPHSTLHAPQPDTSLYGHQPISHRIKPPDSRGSSNFSAGYMTHIPRLATA